MSFKWRKRFLGMLKNCILDIVQGLYILQFLYIWIIPLRENICPLVSACLNERIVIDLLYCCSSKTCILLFVYPILITILDSECLPQQQWRNKLIYSSFSTHVSGPRLRLVPLWALLTINLPWPEREILDLYLLILSLHLD